MGYKIKDDVSAKKAAARQAAPAKTVKSAAKAAKSAKSVKPSKTAQSAPVEAPKAAPAAKGPAVRRAPVIAKAAPKPVQEIDTAKAVAFAMSIAEEMKRSARDDDEQRDERAIRLSRRPTSRKAGEETDKFPEADLREFRKRLLDEREKALSGMDAMKATGFNEAEDHEADGGDGTNQTLRLQALGQMGNINRTIQRIEEALHRIDDGSYGVCTVCGQLIRKPRLLNQPFVLTCMECQSEIERHH